MEEYTQGPPIEDDVMQGQEQYMLFGVQLQ